MKCVMVIDESLPTGLIANTAAVLAISLGNRFGDIVGEDLVDKDGTMHQGITEKPIPILKGNAELIFSIREKLAEDSSDEVYFVDFCDVAQTSVKYEEYKQRLKSTPSNELSYLGLAIYGPKKTVNSLTGSIGLLR